MQMAIHEAIIAFLETAESLAVIGDFVIALLAFLHYRKGTGKKNAPSVKTEMSKS